MIQVSLLLIQFVIGGLIMVQYFTHLLLPFYSYVMEEGATALVPTYRSSGTLGKHLSLLNRRTL